MKSRNALNLALAVFVVINVAACGKKDEAKPDTTAAMAPPPAPAAPATPSVSTIETGKHLGANFRVTAVDSVFGVKDTMYLSVVTANSAPTSTLIAKWTFHTGQLVDSTSQAVARTDTTNPTAVTEFHVAKPKGWPAGQYKVEVWLDGVSAGSRTIEVKK